MIDDPDIIKLHLDRQLFKIQDSSNGVGHLIVRDDDCGLWFLPLDSLNSDGGKKIEATPFYHYPLEHFNYCHINLVEPVNPRVHELSAHNTIRSQKPANFYVSRGFGYDCTADDYRVVNIAQFHYYRDRSSFESETMVYSLKLDSWRRIEDSLILFSHGVLELGALHWMASTTPTTRIEDLIVALDLRTEGYFQLRLPLELSKPENLSSVKHLNVLGGCIALSCLYPLLMVFDVWLVNDYRVENSWTKLFSIAEVDNIGFWPVIYSKSRGQVLLEDKRECFWPEIYSKSIENELLWILRTNHQRRLWLVVNFPLVVPHFIWKASFGLMIMLV
ncbi:hypothetical protein Pfo_000640 [Paulownia fortunei]|nr:hypothetical protein Pfo_000640 [Paulownia fortunei]